MVAEVPTPGREVARAPYEDPADGPNVGGDTDDDRTQAEVGGGLHEGSRLMRQSPLAGRSPAVPSMSVSRLSHSGTARGATARPANHRHAASDEHAGDQPDAGHRNGAEAIGSRLGAKSSLAIRFGLARRRARLTTLTTRRGAANRTVALSAPVRD